MAHPFQHILDAIQAGEHVEYSYASSSWLDILNEAPVAVWHSLVCGQGRYSYRVKPKTVTFPGQKPVLAPVNNPKPGYQYTVLESDGSVLEIVYANHNEEHVKLAKNHALFSSREAAWAYSSALHAFLIRQ